MAKSAPTRVIGIDPGLNITGYGVVECRARNVNLLEAGVIRSSKSQGDNLAARLGTLFDGVREILNEFHPQVMCLEEVYSHVDYPRTAILMGHARGAVCLLCAKYNLQLVSYASTHIKKSIAGRGRASKKQVGGMVKTLLSLKSVPQPEDITDALAIAISHVHTTKHKK